MAENAVGILETSARGLTRRTNPICPSCGGVPNTNVEGLLVQTPAGRNGVITYLRFPCSGNGNPCPQHLDLLPDEIRRLARLKEVGKVGHVLFRMDRWMDTTEKALLASVDDPTAQASLVKALLGLAEAKFKIANLEEKAGVQQEVLYDDHLIDPNGPVADTLAEVADEVFRKGAPLPIRDAEFTEPGPVQPAPVEDEAVPV